MYTSEVGESDLSDIRVVPDIKVVEIDHSDLDETLFTFDIPIPIGTFILGVGTLVKEALAGGSATITVGDEDAGDGWLTSALVVPGTINHFCYSGGAAVTNTQGKYYPTGGILRITCVTGLTAGIVKVMIHSFSLAGNWRLGAL